MITGRADFLHHCLALWRHVLRTTLSTPCFGQTSDEAEKDIESRWAAEDVEEAAMGLTSIEYKEESFAEGGAPVERLSDEFFFSRKSLADVGATDEAMEAFRALGQQSHHALKLCKEWHVS